MIDNRSENNKKLLLEYLDEWGEYMQQFDIATGYFDIDALVKVQDAWKSVKKIRIIIGPEVREETANILVKAQDLKSPSNSERKGYMNHPADKFSKIIQAIISGKIEIRVYNARKFHAKMYIMHSKFDSIPPVALVGSSNFIVQGIINNIELNVMIKSSDQVFELQEWFDQLWSEAECINGNNLQIKNMHTE